MAIIIKNFDDEYVKFEKVPYEDLKKYAIGCPIVLDTRSIFLEKNFIIFKLCRLKKSFYIASCSTVGLLL
jgi:hypothetical protein